MNDGTLTALGFARKAGKLSCGFCAASEAIKKKKSKLVVIACDISSKSEKEIRFAAANNVPVLRVSYSIEQLSAAVGKQAGIFSINDDRFVQSFYKNTGGNANYDKN